MKKLILEEEKKQDVVYLNEINDNLIVGIQYKNSRGLVIKVDFEDFRVLSNQYSVSLDLCSSFKKASIKDYLIYASTNDISFVSAVIFGNFKEALTWFNESK